jgi:hypothetical protein
VDITGDTLDAVRRAAFWFEGDMDGHRVNRWVRHESSDPDGVARRARFA